jgi:hypothetical protein
MEGIKEKRISVGSNGSSVSRDSKAVNDWLPTGQRALTAAKATGILFLPLIPEYVMGPS